MVVYKNMNNFPIIVPGKNGSSITVRTGECLTDPWFGRFTGPRQLVALDDDGSKVSDSATLLPSVKVAVQSPVEVIESVLEEDTEHYVKKNGIYTCKRCNTFRTGSREQLNSHLSDYHQLGPDVRMGIAPPSPVPDLSTSVEPPVEESKAATESSVPGPEFDPKEMLPEVTGTEGVTEETAGEDEGSSGEDRAFSCPVCGKDFGTERGLKMHQSRTGHLDSDSTERVE